LKVDSALASVRALTASLSSSTAASPDTASITVAPIWSSATGEVGTVTVTPASSPKHVGAGTLALPGGLASLTGPAVDVVASVANGSALAGVTAKALGAINVLGTPLAVGTGAINLSSNVTKSAASSTKSITVKQLALPTILDLLNGLGLDLSVLTQSQLMALFNVVAASVGATVTGAVNGLNAAVGTAQGVASSAADTVAEASSELATKQGTVVTDQAALTALFTAISSNSTIATALAATPLPPLNAQSWSDTVTPAQKAIIDLTLSGETLAVDNAIAALSEANAAVVAAQALLDALLALISGVTSALDSDPLASLGNISAGTSAVAGTVGSAAGHLTVGTVEILGANVIPAQLTSALASVTTALSGVLSSIGATFTAPKIAIGAITKNTTQAGKTATAAVTVAGLKITLPTITMPAALALPGADSLPGLSVANGVLSSLAGSVTVAELTDSASFTQGSAASAPGSGGGSLPTTGAPAALGLAALVAIGLALMLRRRTRSTVE
jgi:hypothetical protein